MRAKPLCDILEDESDPILDNNKNSGGAIAASVFFSFFKRQSKLIRA